MKEKGKDLQATGNERGPQKKRNQSKQDNQRNIETQSPKPATPKIMKRNILFSAIFLGGLMLVNLSSNQVYGQLAQNNPVEQQSKEYTCAHHPEIVQDMPGKCPICGMTLVEKKAKAKGDMKPMYDTTKMKRDHKQMKHDTTTMKKDQMKYDTVYRKND